MAPAPAPDNPDLLHTLNAFWVMIAGVGYSIWLLAKFVWNFSSYNQKICDRFDALERDMVEIKTMLCKIRLNQQRQDDPPQKI